MRRNLRRGALAGVAAMATIIAGAAAYVATADVPQSEPTTDTTADAAADEAITLGWYSRWSNDGVHSFFRAKDLHETGAAEAMTHMGYGFANITDDDGEVDGTCGPETSWGDYTPHYSAEDSVDGVADSDDEALWGHFNQFRKLKELHPDLKILISLGGGGGGDNPDGGKPIFEEIAADPQLRAEFVQNCVDTFLRGDLPEVGDRGGPGSAQGIFDGIDVDWEWAEDETRDNYTALHQELREAIDEYGDEVGEEFSLSTTFPGYVDGETEDYDGYDVPELFEVSDFGHVQVYSMYAPWGDQNPHTAFHSQHRDDPDSNQYSRSSGGEAAVEYLIDNGAPAEKIVYGVPAFAHGWSGVPDVDNGVHQTGDGAADTGRDHGSLWYDELMELSGGEHFVDDHAVSAYYYDGDEWYCYDTPETIAIKADYVADRGLGGMMMWELLNNEDGELITAIADSQAG